MRFCIFAVHAIFYYNFVCITSTSLDNKIVKTKALIDLFFTMSGRHQVKMFQHN